jgi:hypothetical protein
MTSNTMLMVAISVFVMMVVSAMILLRIKIGKPKEGSPAAFATKRNSILIVFVILIFLMIWINRMVSGELVEQGISSTIAMLVAVGGGASIILLLVDMFRKK